MKNYGRESVNGACLPCRPPARATTIPQSPQGLRGNKTSFDTCRVAIVIVVQISFEPTQTISVSSVLLSFAHLHNTLSCYIDGLVQDCSNSIALANFSVIFFSHVILTFIYIFLPCSMQPWECGQYYDSAWDPVICCGHLMSCQVMGGPLVTTQKIHIETACLPESFKGLFLI